MIREKVIDIRTKKLPDYNIYPNAGSFFKNPSITKEKGDELKKNFPEITLREQKDGYKIHAAWLIEHIAKMKGERNGSVGTWPSQPLVIVNYHTATSTEVISLSEEIKKTIFEKTGIELEREVNFEE
jgi:UDP-N-acetylmuramate dehydrogenase